MGDYLTERFLRLPDGTLPHMGVKGDGDVAPYVLLSGDPGRVEKIKTWLDKAEAVGNKRGYMVYTGTYRDTPVTLASNGVGAPSTAIAMEELALAGGKVFIRVGSCASVTENIPIGDVVIATGGVRDEGVSHTYAPSIYPAVADPDVVAALRAA
ncbi:MAG: uridine phosphorylase, partial [Candidatus Latescibacteria bacterium]|nr:uridine phosphorylase [Candidatus Latescibacterota bacterium]